MVKTFPFSYFAEKPPIGFTWFDDSCGKYLKVVSIEHNESVTCAVVDNPSLVYR